MYTTAGNFQWVKRAEGARPTTAWGIAADGTGNVYLTGVYGTLLCSTTCHSQRWAAEMSSWQNWRLVDPSAVPVITMQPLNQTAQAGANVMFNLGFVGATPVAYQWLFNGTNIANATNAFFTVSNAMTAQAGGYSVVVSNANGGVTSAVATLSLTVEPDFLWALRAGGPGNYEVLGVVADALGNTYIAGYFSGTADFAGTGLTSYGGEDIFERSMTAPKRLPGCARPGAAGTTAPTPSPWTIPAPISSWPAISQAWPALAGSTAPARAAQTSSLPSMTRTATCAGFRLAVGPAMIRRWAFARRPIGSSSSRAASMARRRSAVQA